MKTKQQGNVLLTTVLASTLLGVSIVLGALWYLQGSTPEVAIERVVSVEYGRQLIRETTRLLGPDHEDPNRRYSGNGLDCASCHLDTGTEPGTLSLLQSAQRYPSFSGREGRDRDLVDRVNGCMTRSMNGRELPRDGVEMLSMISYINHLTERYQVMGESRRQPQEPPAFVEPDRAADIAAGEQVYEQRCQVCHGSDGLGLKESADIRDGYLFPPLWGPESYNNGAGMTRLLTAARFIKARMPLGQPDLTDDQAYDVAAYINSHDRPQRAGLEADYPDLTRKPVDSPYPPYADEFPIEQHRIGPFQPIRDYYRSQ